MITQDTVVVYDTEQHQPIAVVSNLNYSAFTDATWSPDGQSLFVTSVDGFCSAILFDKTSLVNDMKEKLDLHLLHCPQLWTMLSKTKQG